MKITIRETESLVKVYVLFYNKPMPLEKQVAHLLFKKKKTIALAESCTGGLLGARLTDIPGSSKYFMGSVVSYSYPAKEKILKIPKALLLKYGAVSQPVTALMAQNVRRLLATDLGLAITGIAGPTGATKTKPVGLIHISLATPKHLFCRKCILRGARVTVKKKATDLALKFLFDLLQESDE